jgi:hypothetical protein
VDNRSARVMEGISGADNLSVGYGRIDYCKRNRKSLLYSLVRMGFLRQARAGLVTSDYILELVFIEFFVQWKGSSNKLPPASYQTSLRVYPGEIFSLPLFSKSRFISKIIIVIIMIPGIFDIGIPFFIFWYTNYLSIIFCFPSYNYLGRSYIP